MKNISVFCGAHKGKNPNFAIAAESIAKSIANKGINIVFGGGNVGLMKIISDTALDNGVEVLGISLKSLHSLELSNPRLNEIVLSETLLERKDKFMQRSDAFIVLPGGVGSLDELAEIMASNQLGIINKPLGILNTDGYYDDLLSWLNKAVDEGFISSANLRELIVSDSPEDLVEMVTNHQRPPKENWTKRLGL
mgnify:CR=1 FL=1|tara:strand:+ start:15734 stop:16315 length:582 start_codon:yes stop_codon:yes gene_type:complete